MRRPSFSPTRTATASAIRPNRSTTPTATVSGTVSKSKPRAESRHGTSRGASPHPAITCSPPRPRSTANRRPPSVTRVSSSARSPAPITIRTTTTISTVSSTTSKPTNRTFRRRRPKLGTMAKSTSGTLPAAPCPAAPIPTAICFPIRSRSVGARPLRPPPTATGMESRTSSAISIRHSTRWSNTTALSPGWDRKTRATTARGRRPAV